MNSSKEHILHLWQLYLANRATGEEVKELFHLVSQADDNREHTTILQQLLSTFPADKILDAEVRDGMIERILEGRDATTDFKSADSDLTSISYSHPSVHRVHFLKTAWFRYAAVLLLIAGSATFLYLRHQVLQKQLIVKRPVAQPYILPGGNKATLTLADGSTILLDSAASGSLAQQGTTRVLKLDAGSLAYEQDNGLSGPEGYNTITTPRGGQYQITLPDGSRVWLNAESSVRFPTRFVKDRTLTITGEVYLEVAKDKTNPFRVLAGETEVRVLGTSFNINAYPDEDAIKTTLIEGGVQVSAGKELKTLTPGQQLSFNVQSRKVAVNTANVEQVLAWKNGAFYFKDADVKTLMRQLGRWYDIDIVYKGSIPARKFQGKIGRDLNLPDVLDILKKFDVNFRIEGRTLIILP